LNKCISDFTFSIRPENLDGEDIKVL